MKHVIFIISFLFTGILSAQLTYVPDDNFENYLETHDANGNLVAIGNPNSMGNGIANDNYVTTSKINTVTVLQVAGQHISDMTGIEDFTALTHLECQYNQIINLDISQNTALTHLTCYYNQLSGLDVSQNAVLTELDCSTNHLSYLNIGQNANLTIIRCANNQLTSLDLSQIPNLNILVCAINQLSNLNINQNTTLNILSCSDNQLTDLDVSNNSNLSELYCQNNQLTILDLSNNPILEKIYCESNHLTKLNLRNGNNTAITGFFAANNPDLFCVEVDDPSYMNANWPGAIDTTAIYNTHCETYVPDDNFENYLESLGMGNGIANDNYVSTVSIMTITNLFLPYQNITDLTGIEDFTELTNLDCSQNQLIHLDVTQNKNLTSLNCSLNHLTNLDVTQNAHLQFLYCESNNLNSLDTSQNPDLLILSCNSNQISNLDVTQNPYLTELKCYNNQLNNLDISHNPDLTYFYCDINNLTNLDISHNPNLYYFSCSNNQINHLDLTQNTALRTLNCTHNNLTDLNISQNTALEKIYCYDNHLSILDVTHNTLLTDFDCSVNQLVTLDIRNGNNTMINYFKASNNPNLTCIFVDDTVYSSTHWNLIDPTSHFVATQAECDAQNIDKNQFNKAIKFYPNPVNNILTITNKTNLDLKIYIYNILGMMVYQAETLPEQIDTSHLQTGMYLIKIDSKNLSITKKLIVKHL